jgi:hypothetical protein
MQMLKATLHSSSKWQRLFGQLFSRQHQVLHNMQLQLTRLHNSSSRHQ